ncbi:MerR family transcriptional regulator [Microbacterium sp. NPDC056234]|uniref:MerR family transcriptional regulator n=1 Tax=Microbacterium sp. NPDC056234 TaxID=3345757 RepID=UPI0035D822B3
MPETMHIGELAERTGMSLRTLRHYDEIGLLTPSGRSDGGFRLYTDEDLRRLLVIRRMKPLGYSLEQMGDLLRVLDAADHTAEARTVLQDFRADAAERRDRLAKQLEMADEFLEQLDRI